MPYSYINIEVKSRNVESREKIEHYLTPCYEVFKKIHHLTDMPIQTESKTIWDKNKSLTDFVTIEIHCTVYEYEKIIAEIKPIFECAKKIYEEMQVRVRTEIDIVTAERGNHFESCCEHDAEDLIDE